MTNSINKTQLDNPVKKLCELGICVSMAEARRLVANLDPKRLEKIIERNKNKISEEKIPPSSH